MTHLKMDYVEFESGEIGRTTKFLADAFGWTFNDYGPDYQEIANGGVNGGVSSPEGERQPPLVILKADDLEAAEKSVTSAGGEIIRPIFSFPGGRRFHFREPGGNVMAVWSEN